MVWPKVCVITLSWNGLEDTLDCLKSLFAVDYPDMDVIVVDNGSHDGTPEAVRTAFPSVTVLETGSNLGFTGGNNIGIEQARETGAAYILLLNNDTEVAPDFLCNLVEAAEADPRVGIVGPTIYYFTQPDVVWSAGGSIDWRKADSSMLGLGQVDTGQFGIQPRPVDFVTGCALLLKVGVFNQIGSLDPRFHAYYEETEWCVRARRAGYEIYHVPLAHIWHKITPEAREASPLVHYYMTRNRLLFMKLTKVSTLTWVKVLFGEYLVRLVSWSIKPKWRYKSPQRQAMLQAIYDYSRGRFGAANMVG